MAKEVSAQVSCGRHVRDPWLEAKSLSGILVRTGMSTILWKELFVSTDSVDSVRHMPVINVCFELSERAVRGHKRTMEAGFTAMQKSIPHARALSVVPPIADRDK